MITGIILGHGTHSPSIHAVMHGELRLFPLVVNVARRASVSDANSCSAENFILPFQSLYTRPVSHIPLGTTSPSHDNLFRIVKARKATM